MRISDWSSDVCSSDLMGSCGRCVAEMEGLQRVRTAIRSLPLIELPPGLLGEAEPVAVPLHRNRGFWVGAAAAGVAVVIAIATMQIGRASCRERMGQYV